MIDGRILRGLGPSAVAAETELEVVLADVVIGLDLAEDPTGRMIGTGLADQLVRWFHRFVVGGPAAREALDQAARWAGASITIGDGTPDHRIAIGPSFGDDADLFVGADGWRVHLSRRNAQRLGSPGLGAAAAPHVAMLELFKTLFADWVDVEPCDEVHLSLFDWTAEGTDPGPNLEEVDLGTVVWIGSGAIAHGGLAALHDLPTVRGRVNLIDPDPYSSSTVRRYARAAVAWEGLAKPATVGSWLDVAHPDLHVEGHSTDANSWFESQAPDCLVSVAVTTPDSPDARRHVALKLPKVVVNGYAERFDIGIGTYRLGQGPCLGCRYPMSSEAISEVSIFHAEVGLEPRRIRELLDAVAPLDDEDVGVVLTHLGLDEAIRAVLVGKPLRSVREHLCAVGRLTAPAANTDVDVPLGFVSALCGVAVVADLVRHSIGLTRDPGWKVNLQVPVTTFAYWPQRPMDDCFICSDPDYVDAYQAKYG